MKFARPKKKNEMKFDVLEMELFELRDCVYSVSIETYFVSLLR